MHAILFQHLIFAPLILRLNFLDISLQLLFKLDLYDEFSIKQFLSVYANYQKK